MKILAAIKRALPIPINVNVNVNVHVQQQVCPPAPIAGEVRIGSTGRPWIHLPHIHIPAGRYFITLQAR